MRNARALHQTTVDAGAIASFLAVSTGSKRVFSGDFGDVYPEYEYSYDAMLITKGCSGWTCGSRAAVATTVRLHHEHFPVPRPDSVPAMGTTGLR